MESVFNEILFNDSLSDADKVRLLQLQTKKSQKAKDDMSKGKFGSSSFKYDRFVLSQECERAFGGSVWAKLSEKSKTDLVNAYLYEEFVEYINDDQSTPISKLTKTVENEIRDKLFFGFIKSFNGSRLEVSCPTDKNIDNSIIKFEIRQKVVLTLGQMFHAIKDSDDDDTISNYAYELKTYLINNRWNAELFYSKKERKYYIWYPDKYRNDASHEYIYDKQLTCECKKDTIEILSWFLGSLC